MCTDAYISILTDTHTHTDIDMSSHIQTHTFRLWNTSKHTYRHQHTHTHTRKHTSIHTYKHIHSPILLHIHTHTIKFPPYIHTQTYVGPDLDPGRNTTLSRQATGRNGVVFPPGWRPSASFRSGWTLGIFTAQTVRFFQQYDGGDPSVRQSE